MKSIAEKVGPLSSNEFTKTELLKLVLSAALGASLAIIIAVVINIILIQISFNAFFSAYVGFLLIFSGVISYFRINKLPETETINNRKPFLKFFSVLLILAGMFCFLLDKQWFFALRYFEKIPLYLILAMTLHFTITFAVLDLINFIHGFFTHSYATPVVDSQTQITVVLIISFVMGSLSGIIFGVLDVEDKGDKDIDVDIMEGSNLFMPISFIMGSFAGFINEYLRTKGERTKFKPIADPFSEEI